MTMLRTLLVRQQKKQHSPQWTDIFHQSEEIQSSAGKRRE